MSSFLDKLGWVFVVAGFLAVAAAAGDTLQLVPHRAEPVASSLACAPGTVPSSMHC